MLHVRLLSFKYFFFLILSLFHFAALCAFSAAIRFMLAEPQTHILYFRVFRIHTHSLVDVFNNCLSRQIYLSLGRNCAREKETDRNGKLLQIRPFKNEINHIIVARVHCLRALATSQGAAIGQFVRTKLEFRTFNLQGAAVQMESGERSLSALCNGNATNLYKCNMLINYLFEKKNVVYYKPHRF